MFLEEGNKYINTYDEMREYLQNITSTADHVSEEIPKYTRAALTAMAITEIVRSVHHCNLIINCDQDFNILCRFCTSHCSLVSRYSICS